MLTVFKISFRSCSKYICVPVSQAEVTKTVALLTDDFMPNSKYLVCVTSDLHFPDIKSLMKQSFFVSKLKQMLFHWSEIPLE